MTFPRAITAVVKIKEFFNTNGLEYSYINQKGNNIHFESIEDGVLVNCLATSGYKDFLPWGVFFCAVELLLELNGTAARGEAMSGPLGSERIGLNTIEGRIAHNIYGKQPGDSVFRRISPIAKILIISGVCQDRRGDLVLVSS